MKTKDIITNPILNIKNIVGLNFGYFTWYIVDIFVAEASIQSRQATVVLKKRKIVAYKYLEASTTWNRLWNWSNSYQRPKKVSFICVIKDEFNCFIFWKSRFTTFLLAVLKTCLRDNWQKWTTRPILFLWRNFMARFNVFKQLLKN